MGIGLFIFGTVIGLINVVVRDLAMFPELYGKIAFLSIVIAGLLTIGIGFVFPKKHFIKRNRPDLRTDKLGYAPAAVELPSAERSVDDLVMPHSNNELITEPASVTDRTTRRLG